VTGATGGLGLLVAGHLVSRGARHLVLVARKSPSASFVGAVEDMRRAGARIDLASGTVADRAFVRGLVDGLTTAGTVLRGVVHAAGALDDGVVAQQSWARFRTVMEAKVHGAWNIHLATENMPLDFFVLFSSSAALLGAAGQANYAAGNAFMDALAQYRRSRGLQALSVNWGPWSGVGAAARGGVVDRGKSRGLGSIDPANGLEVFDALVASGSSQAVVINADWKQMLAGGLERMPSLLREVGDRQPVVRQVSEPAGAAPWLLQQLDAARALQRWPLLVEKLAGEAAAVLGVDAAELDPHQGLRDMGLDSLMALELRNRLQRAVGRPLRTTLAFDFPTIEAIAHHISDDILQLAPDTDTSGASSAPPADIAGAGAATDLLQEIESLSDDEVDKLFASRVSGAGA
jgi:short-subunit dehydrogenase/acyl carrier protein